jgi:hypothetical protein
MLNRLKPGDHCIGSRVETRLLSSCGSTCIQLVQPHLDVISLNASSIAFFVVSVVRRYVCVRVCGGGEEVRGGVEKGWRRVGLSCELDGSTLGASYRAQFTRDLRCLFYLGFDCGSGVGYSLLSTMRKLLFRRTSTLPTPASRNPVTESSSPMTPMRAPCEPSL